MFVAIGIGAKRDSDGTIRANVGLFDDRIIPPKKVRDQVFTGANITAVRTAIATQLAQMKANEDDSALNDQVAGRELGRV